jgi:conjugal transfer pilus assembly protein TraW
VLAACSTPMGSFAEDLGVNGQTYQLDPDAREQIKDVIRRKQQSGELARFWASYRNRTIEAIKHPTPLGVPTNYAPSQELRPLRFTLPQDYVDEHGVVLARRGTVVEPLKILPLTAGLIFVDGRDPRQVEYAIARGQREPLKIVLVAGSAFDLRVKYQRAAWRGAQGIPFYFDQRRMILDSLQRLYGLDVSHVPALLHQEGSQLRIEYGIGVAS